MNHDAILATKLSKQYSIGQSSRSRYSTLREALAGVNRQHAAINRSSSTVEDNTYWALRDVDLRIPRGETVGIIGRNGAGKSTLLKILSRITSPTSGSATVFGRVGSLLEVGSGFHLELTGRENIYLSGAILGMRKQEIDTNFDSIVEFAGVDKFVDTPVKHYSTGMYLRLAFAVAAHLQSEILLIDEVLSVGDAAFQQRCIGKMGEVAKAGRTVLFVSHNMAAVRSLCTQGIVLDQGRVAFRGDISACTNAYFQLIGALGGRDPVLASEAIDHRHNIFERVTVGDGNGHTEVAQSEPIRVSTHLHVPSGANGFMLFCLLEDMDGRTLFCLRRESQELARSILPNTRYRIELTLPPLWLNPGLYTVYFKVLLHGELPGISRHLSDKFPLDVVGESSAITSVLHPRSDWLVTSASLGSSS
jgi:lipopolysaccharide transport system ATP-binding protein